MAGQVQFYVNGVHSIGGVTTWSFQAASFLAGRYPTSVVTVHTGQDRSGQTFPGPVTEVWRRAEGPAFRSVRTTRETLPERPAKPSKPVKKVKKPVKPTREVKPTKPVKKPIVPPPLPEDDGGGSSEPQSEMVDPADATLHHSAERAIASAKIFIPNYLDFAYKLAARSRARGIASRCIGVCHCDQDNYYKLLTRYAPIIHSFIAVSPRCRDRLLNLLPARAGDIHLVPYGVATPRDHRATHGTGPIRLLYAGRLVRTQKRIFDLVEIVSELDRRGTDYRLDIVGVGPDREPLAAALSHARRVRFHPGVFHSEISSVYRNHDVFLLPSETEGTSIALLESMAHGLVPVATRVSGSEDAIIDGFNGMLCDVGDVRQMVDGIVALASNHSKRREMSDRARQTIERNYRIDDQLNAFEHCLQQTLGKPLVPVEAARSVLDSSDSPS
jgi:glycosyltransferase involved in cell wall biosynthesis